MAEEFPAGIWGRRWSDSTKTVFMPVANRSPCSMELIDMIRSNSCPTGFEDRNVKFCNEKALDSDSLSGDGTFLIDPTVRTTSDCNQTLLGDGDTGTTLCSNYDHQETSGFDEQENHCSIFKADDFVLLMDQPNLSSANFYDSITTTCQGSSMGFPVGTISNGYCSTLLQNSWDQPKQFLFSNRVRPILNNASAAALHAFQSGFFPSSQSKSSPASTLEGKPKCPNLTKKLISCEVVQDSGRVQKKNRSSETLIKRPRSDMPSPLPPFKVRKEKLGALQQLVSPFGKTDTASVLDEANEYIKFLHDQVRVLSTPYMKIADNNQDQQVEEELKKNKKKDLRSRGLCLVAISSTVALANGNALDFWSPTYGGTFR